jgi:DNA-binding GntR family transcriptional regulator
MCPGESAGRPDGQGRPDDLVSAILARIAGGDLPAGADIDPAVLARLFEATEPDIDDALLRLEAHGAVGRANGRWRVAEGGGGQGRDLLHWAVPLLRAVVALAAARITPVEAAGILAAYDRHVGLAGDGSAASRAEGYRQLMERLASASGSRFHMATMAGLLDQAEPSVQRMVVHQMASRRAAEPDDELGRLAAALMQGNAAMASAAIEDHLILLSRYLDCLEPIRR